MANGFNYESGLNRLLSVTIPNFVNQQLDRQERARQFDESVEQREADRALRELQLETNLANAEKRFELEELRYQEGVDRQKRRERDAKRERRRLLDDEEQTLEVNTVEEYKNPDEALSYLESLRPTLTSKKAIAYADRLGKKISSYKDDKYSAVNIFKDILDPDVYQTIKQMDNWTDEMSISEVNSAIVTFGNVDKLENKEQMDKLNALSKGMTSVTTMLKAIPPAIPGQPDPYADQRSAAINNYTNVSKRYFDELSKAGISIKDTGVKIFDEVRVDGVDAIVTQVPDINSAKQLNNDSLFKTPGSDIVFIKKGDNDVEVYRDDDFIKAANALNVSIDAPAEASDMPGQSAIERLVATSEMEAPPGGVSGGFARFLRRLPGVQEQMGTGKGGFLSMEGSPKEQVEAVGLLDRNTKIILENLKDARKEQVSLTKGFETSEEYQTQKRENNTSLQNYIQNAYEAYLDERTTPAVKSKLKKFLSEFKSLAGKPMITGQATLGRDDALRPIRVTGGENIFNEDTIDLLNQIEL
tara:strand:+ start:1435 stop:3021 length:1587 start_codon:yes stop_codon:yes gene_type:complete